MVILIVTALMLLLAYSLFNFKTLLSLLIGFLFFLVLVTVPVFIARLYIVKELLGSHYSFSLVYLLALGAIILFTFRMWGRYIFRDRVLNFIMGIALFAGLCLSLILLAFRRAG